MKFYLKQSLLHPPIKLIQTPIFKLTVAKPLSSVLSLFNYTFMYIHQIPLQQRLLPNISQILAILRFHICVNRLVVMQIFLHLIVFTIPGLLTFSGCVKFFPYIVSSWGILNQNLCILSSYLFIVYLTSDKDVKLIWVNNDNWPKKTYKNWKY